MIRLSFKTLSLGLIAFASMLAAPSEADASTLTQTYTTYDGGEQGVTIRDGTSLAQSGGFDTGLSATGIAYAADNTLYIAAGNGIYHYSVGGSLLTQFNWGDNSITYTDVAVPSSVPEIDPAGIDSVLALVLGSLGLLERRRLKAA